MLGFDCQSTGPSFGRSMRVPQGNGVPLEIKRDVHLGYSVYWRDCMNRNVIGIVAAFTLLVGGAMATTKSEAVAGHHCGGHVVCGGNVCGGGLFARLKARHHSCAAPAPVCQPVVHHCGGHRVCGGGLFAKLRAHRQSSCCAPEPVCCAPEPVCCAPEPVCCTPAPAPCCTVAPVAAPCCEVIVSEEVVGEAVEEGSSSDAPPAHEAEVEST